jgi:hypothetical protein
VVLSKAHHQRWVLLVLLALLGGLLLIGFLAQSGSRQFAPASTACPSVPTGAPPAQRSSSLIVGLNSVWNDGCDLKAVVSAGATYERYGVPWASVEPRPGRWTFATFDRDFATAARYGVTMLPVLMDIPGWAGRAWNAIPANPARFAAYVAQVVARYGPRGEFWRSHPRIPYRPARWFEIWNEPYLEQFSAGGPNPGAYARLFSASVAAGRSANPAARFLIQANVVGKTSDGDSAPWIEPMYAAVPDLSRYVDGVAVHPYTSTQSPSTGDADADFGRIAVVRQQFAAHGAGSRPFWITEIGWSTCPGDPSSCVSESEQAGYLERVFQLVRGPYASFVHAVFPYNYRDGIERDGTDPERWFGLLRRNGVPKHAWSVLRAAGRS